MQIPDKIKIGGFDYEIVKINREEESGTNNPGSHSAQFQKIWVDTHTLQSQQERVLLHEIIEAVNYYNELDLSHTQICVLEYNLYQVLKDNKLLKE